ncbi:MAG: flavodoxin family protein [Methanomassiliicoccales archaeon]|jgi:multimeric flavodoxin WrbA|nr:flavodoxin family protein [Methanomassiliicoccales archaeon]
MKALIFNGSARKNGNTATLLERICVKFAKASIDFEWINLTDLKIEDCRGCLACKKNGRCEIDDDMQTIYEKIQEVDFIVLGSPVYMGAETGRVKSFVDRLYAFLRFTDKKGVFESNLKKGKKAIVVFSCGLKDGDIVYNHLNVRYFNIFVRLLGCDDMRSFIIPSFYLVEKNKGSHDSSPLKQLLDETSRFIGMP